MKLVLDAQDVANAVSAYVDRTDINSETVDIEIDIEGIEADIAAIADVEVSLGLSLDDIMAVTTKPPSCSEDATRPLMD